MKNPTDKAKEYTDKLKRRYFIGFSHDFFKAIKEIAIENESIQYIVDSFISNLESIEKVVSFPYILSEQFANKRAFSMHISKNAIIHPELEHDQVMEIAKREFEESFENQDDANRIFIDLCSTLVEIPQNEYDPACELLNQGILLTWSAFEVFCRDYIEKRLNENPKQCIPILENDKLRRRLDLKKMPIEYLLENDFDLSEKIGTIIVENYDCSDLLIIKELLLCINNNHDLKDFLNNNDLWILFQIRHLLMHRRGIIDKYFMEKTHIEQKIGERIIISPSYLYRNISMIEKIVRTLIS
jgi:hypothetical protein